MTPAQLLEQAKSRFIVLYHNDPVKLELLLRQSLGKYADKAGVTVTKKIPFTEVARPVIPSTSFVPSTPLYYAPLPENLKDTAMAKDAKGLWHDVEKGINPDTDAQCLVFQLWPGESVSPMTVEYFVELRDWPLDAELPVGVASPVLDYLVAMIDIPNTERERSVAQQAGQQTELPSKSELQAKVDQLELSWEENAAYVGSTVLW